MKRSGCKSVIRLLFVQVVLFLSVTAFAADVDKQFKKEYDASGVELLKISNRYGDVEIVSSGNNKVVIVVDVQLEHPNQDKAEKLLSMITVEFSNNDNTIEAWTEIDRNFSMNNQGPRRGFSIDYRIEMPEDLNIDVSNKYGNIKAGTLSGHVDIGLKYGSLYIKSLKRGNVEPLNRISAAYLRTGSISDAGWLELITRYVNDMDITTAQALLIDSKYSSHTIGKVSSVVIDNKYDKINIDKVNNLVAESGYTAFNIGNVAKKLDIDTRYGSVEVGNVEAGFELVKVDVEYVGVKIGFDNTASYSLKGETRYAGFSFDESRADIKVRIDEGHSKEIEAVIGNDTNPQSKVLIESRYGSINLR